MKDKFAENGARGQGAEGRTSAGTVPANGGVWGMIATVRRFSMSSSLLPRLCIESVGGVEGVGGPGLIFDLDKVKPVHVFTPQRRCAGQAKTNEWIL